MNEPRRILIVDDQPEFREIFTTELKTKGYEVSAVASGAEALKVVKDLRPDLILMDVQMPEMTGVEALLKLKEDPATTDIKIVFLTSLGNEDKESGLINDLAARDIEAAGYIKKSEDMEALLQEVAIYLN